MLDRPKRDIKSTIIIESDDDEEGIELVNLREQDATEAPSREGVSGYRPAQVQDQQDKRTVKVKSYRVDDSGSDEEHCREPIIQVQTPVQRFKKKMESSDDDYQPGAFSKRLMKKSVKSSRKKVKHDPNRPSPFGELPLELVAMIFSHLTPGDLLQLLSTSKQFNHFLKNSEAHRIWKQAREALDLPDLSSNDVKEWQYAYLLYDTHCDFCNSPNGILDFGLRKKMCTACKKLHVIKYSAFQYQHPDLHSASLVCALKSVHYISSRVWQTARGAYFLDDLQFYALKLEQLKKEDDDDYGAVETVRSRRRAVLEHAWAAKTSTKLPGGVTVDVKVIESQKVKYKPRWGPKVTSFVAGRRDYLHKVIEDARTQQQASGRIWVITRDTKREEQLKASKKKENRKEDLQAKLLASGTGWDQDHFESSTFSNSSLVKKAEALSDDVWTALLPKMPALRSRIEKELATIALMSRQKHRRGVLREAHGALRAAQASAFAELTFPTFDNFLGLEAVRTAWEADEVDVDGCATDDWYSRSPTLHPPTYSTTLDALGWSSILPSVQVDVDRHSEKTRMLAIDLATDDAEAQAFRGKLDGPCSEDDFPKSLFDKLSNFFACGKCYHPIRLFGPFENVLRHQHSYHTYDPYPPDTGDEEAVIKALNGAEQAIMAKIFELTKLDPTDATVEDLAKFDSAWEYRTSNAWWRRQQYVGLTWRGLLSEVRNDEHPVRNIALPRWEGISLSA